MLLYRLLIIVIYSLRVTSSSTPTREAFSLQFNNLIRLLISIELFQPISFI